MHRLLLITAIAAASPAVRANTVADEVSAGTTLATATQPRSSWIANRIAGAWDVDDRVTLQFDATVTRSSGYSKAGSLALSYLPDDHWSLSVEGSWVPSSTRSTTTTLVIEELDDELAVADAELNATSSSTSLAVTVGYGTAGDGDHETSVSLTLGVDHVQSQQTFASIVDEDGQMLTTDDLRAYCMLRTCDPEIQAALSPLWSQLSRFSITAGVVQTEYRDVDLGVDVTYYLYDKDPTLAGYFRIPGIGPSNLGDGVAIAPLHYAISPAVSNRWGDLQGTIGLAYGSYVAGQGYEVRANARVQYRVDIDDDTAVRLYSGLDTSWSVDAYHELMTSLSMSLGGKYSW